MWKPCVALSFVCLLAACASGKNFERPAADSLKIGETTQSDVKVYYGRPFSMDRELHNDRMVTTLVYAYGTGNEEPNRPGIKPSRVMTLYFDGESLVGYTFSSSFRSDQTDFDEAKMDALKIGKSCSVATALYGPTDVEFAHPIADSGGKRIIGYNYHQNYSTKPDQSDMYLKKLHITCDENDMIADVDFIERGKR